MEGKATIISDHLYVGLSIASQEVTWLRRLLLTILPDYTEHQCDNQGAIITANQPTYMMSGRSKHIDVRFHVVRDAAANGLIRLEYVRTEDMTADILTNRGKPFSVTLEGLEWSE